ncbi:DUF5052 family protein [Thermoflavimicrobium dichotomicum]|uniref:DUF5052 domain-containing protein n=1 Tax=Thermoflavimicrobium dichotomicum TaxID=46223 RepID=A0A1I3JMY7_9BACL|nr:DUF5052 family protein [Thermoflavimicrobium dichotomicum]SFI61480.1 hypothetical protein SAMN05421852_101130 [Thermoflavimicrobium dichotomicum]
MKGLDRVRKGILLCIIAIILLLGACTPPPPPTAEQERDLKDSQSNWYGGLNRIVTVYDQNGKPIKTYEGRIDIEPTDGGKVKFEVNGKRIIIYNATVIAEEK